MSDPFADLAARLDVVPVADVLDAALESAAVDQRDEMSQEIGGALGAQLGVVHLRHQTMVGATDPKANQALFDREYGVDGSPAMPTMTLGEAALSDRAGHYAADTLTRMILQ